MPKALSISGIVVAVVLLLLFGLDLIVGFPFSKASLTVDIGLCVAAAILAYMSWSTLRDIP